MQCRGALEDEDVFLFHEVIVELIRVLSRFQFIDSGADVRTSGLSAQPLESIRSRDLLPRNVLDVERLETPLAVL